METFERWGHIPDCTRDGMYTWWWEPWWVGKDVAGKRDGGGVNVSWASTGMDQIVAWNGKLEKDGYIGERRGGEDARNI